MERAEIPFGLSRSDEMPAQLDAMNSLARHWPEYLIEAAGLCLFMISACSFGTLLENPASPVRQAITDPLTRRVLKSAMDLLRPIDKAVLVLSDVEEFSDQEIGQAVGLSTSAVKTSLHRARLFLRGKLAVSLGYSAA